MNGYGLRAIIFTICIVFGLLLISGCEEQRLPDTKQSRFVAAENIQLKKQLEQRDEDIASQNQLYGQQLQEQQQLLAKCKKSVESLKIQANKNIQEQVSSVLTAVMEMNAKLQKENAQLKTQLKTTGE